MAQTLAAPPPAILRNAPIDPTLLRTAREDLAACLRVAALHGLSEGICNHFSLMVPGRDDLFLVNPYGLGFGEVTASSLLVCDFEGRVVDGAGEPEATAFYIHARLHMKHPRARAAFHTHMPNATALTMVEGPPFSFSLQTSLRFLGRLAVDEVYGGLALDNAEGDRIAAAMGDADVVFMRNHGVMVVAPSAAEAWDELYYLERAAEAEVLALSTGRKLVPVPPAMAKVTAAAMGDERAASAAQHLASVKRRLDRIAPGWRD